MYHANRIADKASKIFCMKKSLKDQVESFMAAKGLKPKDVAALVASHQKDLPAKSQCKRQDIENLLTKDFKSVRYMVALARAMETDSETLSSGLYTVPESSDTPAGSGTVAQPVAPYAATVTPLPTASLAQALRVVGDAIVSADDLSRDQMRPLLERWTREPERSGDIIGRLLEILARPASPTKERAQLG